MSQKAAIAAIILAAGSGSRAGGGIPKQYRMVAGRPLLRHSYAALAEHPAITERILVIGRGQEAAAAEAVKDLPPAIFVTGGEFRRDSVRAALDWLADAPPDFVLIHDAARPFLPAHVIDDLIAALAHHTGATPVLPVVDSLARGDRIMGETVEREGLWRIQTPQAFRYDAIMRAHRTWDIQREASDDARMLMAAGGDVALVKGSERLAKFTFASDFADDNDDTIAEKTLGDKEDGMTQPAFRSGTGYDVHRLAIGEELWLCGIRLDHHSGLSGHSDADVALHALTDAILGAMALGDIGDHFPPSDARWRGAASDQFLAHAMTLARQKGYQLANVDVTIICEAPRIGPHRAAMRARLAEILMVSAEQISVKATTTEKLGFTGREEGIAAQAVASFTCAAPMQIEKI